MVKRAGLIEACIRAPLRCGSPILSGTAWVFGLRV